MTTARGKWNAPTRFLPSAVLTPVFPPIAGIDLARQRRRHRDPRQGRAGTLRRRSRRRRSSSRRRRRRSSRHARVASSPQSRSTTSRRFAASPWRKPVQRAVDGRRVQLEHALVGDDLDRTVDVDLAAQANARAPREARPPASLGDRVRRLGVDRLARGVELAEVFLAPRERPVRSAHALPRSLDVHVEETVNARARSRSRLSGESTAPPPRAITDSSARQHLGERCPPRGAETRARRAAKSSGIGPWRRSISRVEVDERPRGQLGDPRADRRLAGAHEAGEREVAS